MISSLQPDDSIPAHVFERANNHNVGMPLKKHKDSRSQEYFSLFFLVFPFLLGWLCYDSYCYIAFTELLHTYPKVTNVPISQLESYIWLKMRHDYLLSDALVLFPMLIGTFVRSFWPFRLNKPKIYICTEGLLLIHKKKDEAIRWDEVKHLYLYNGNVLSLERADKSAIGSYPPFTSNPDDILNKVTIEEVTRCQLPDAIVRLEAGEVLKFAYLKLDLEGISAITNEVEWEQIEKVELRKQYIFAFYPEIKRFGASSQSSVPELAKWHKLTRYGAVEDLHLLVALMQHMLEQRANPIGTSLPSGIPAFNSARKFEFRNIRRGSGVFRFMGIVLLLCVQVFLLYLLLLQPALEKQQKAVALQLIREQPYAVSVPGQYCDNGQGYWSDYSGENSFTCRQDGLLMTLNDMKYFDQTGFSFSSVDQSTMNNEPLIPHHYRIQVKATFVAGDPGSCVGLLFHVNNSAGGQSFQLFDDGSWTYNGADPGSNSFYTRVSGGLPRALKSFVLTVDVTDNVQTLYINNKEIASEQDATYSSTDEIDLIVSKGNPDLPKPVSALFSDFRYTPYP